MKHYKSVEFHQIFRMSSPPAQIQSSRIEDFLLTVLGDIVPNPIEKTEKHN